MVLYQICKFGTDWKFKMATIDGQSLTWKPMGICTKLFFSESTKPVDLICSIAAPNCKQKDFFIGNRFKKSICLFLNPIVRLLLFCLYMLVIPIKYVYTKGELNSQSPSLDPPPRFTIKVDKLSLQIMAFYC